MTNSELEQQLNWANWRFFKLSNINIIVAYIYFVTYQYDEYITTHSLAHIELTNREVRRKKFTFPYKCICDNRQNLQQFVLSIFF